MLLDNTGQPQQGGLNILWGREPTSRRRLWTLTTPVRVLQRRAFRAVRSRVRVRQHRNRRLPSSRTRICNSDHETRRTLFRFAARQQRHRTSSIFQGALSHRMNHKLFFSPRSSPAFFPWPRSPRLACGARLPSSRPAAPAAQAPAAAAPKPPAAADGVSREDRYGRLRAGRYLDQRRPASLAEIQKKYQPQAGPARSSDHRDRSLEEAVAGRTCHDDRCGTRHRTKTIDTKDKQVPRRRGRQERLQGRHPGSAMARSPQKVHVVC